MLRNVFGQNAPGMHLENQVGNLRYDMTNGQPSYVLNQAGGVRTVMGPDGRIHIERQVGNVRYDMTDRTTNLLL